MLIPELLLMTGIPDDFDERRRRQITNFSIVPPSEKYDELKDIFRNLNSDSGSFNPNVVKEKLGISLGSDPATISAKQLQLP